MFNEFKRLSIVGKIYLILNIAVGLIYFFVPFIKVGQSEVTAFYFPISLIFGIARLAVSSSSSAQSFDSLISTNGLQVILTILVFSIWFIFLYFFCTSVTRFYKGENKGFLSISRKGFLADILIPIVFFIARLVIIRTNIQQMTKYISSYTDYKAGSVGDLGFNFLIGFYLILGIGILGFFVPRIVAVFNLKEYDKKINEVTSQTKDLATKGAKLIGSKLKEEKDLIAEKITESSDNPRTVPTNSVTLEGNGMELRITDFPSKVGSEATLSDFVIPNKIISGEHISINIYEDGFLVSDLNSTNKTYLNNEKLEPGEYYQLRNGDQLKLGNVDFIVKI